MSEWVTSSACVNMGDCVEVAWRKASACSYTSTCVEVAETATEILVRDGKDPEGAVLSFTRDEWDAFLAGVRNGEFDSPPAGE